MIKILFYLSSGLFLGWSLGANGAANIFGTAVCTRMVRFSTAAIISSVFIILGSVISGSGASNTLGDLGKISTLPGSFIVALAAAITIMWMTKSGLPVSSSQALVGAIVGWNYFLGIPTSVQVVSKIVSTWAISPILSAIFAFVLFHIFKTVLEHSKIHLIRLDSLTRTALIVVGIFGAYSLGANNIANVMGVFINSYPFPNLKFNSIYEFSSTHQLFLLGSIAIAIGVFTYSKRVMLTVGSSIFKLSPINALIVVLASSSVLFIFSSQNLHDLLISLKLPAFPLVPISISQSSVGAVLGITTAKKAKNIHFAILGKIGLGWIFTPVAAALLSYFSLFFMQNVFMQNVR
jgi:PiT family inorganic phosphate transporter